MLIKLKFKNRGNIKLCCAVDQLLLNLQEKNWQTKEEIKNDRPDADQVHSEGFYFFDISLHRTLVLILFEDAGEATIIWVGPHDKYERVFKNNKDVVRRYLSDNNWI